MNDDRLQEIYGRAITRRAAQSEPCDIPPEAMLDLLEGRLPEVQRRRLLEEIQRRPACQEEFALLGAVVRASREVQAPRRPRWLVPVAAAAVLLVAAGVLGRGWWSPAEPVLRSGSTTIAVVGPSGATDTAAPQMLVWHPLPGSWRYEVDVVDGTGAARYRGETADTMLQLPDSAWPPPGVTYHWWVRGRLPGGEVVRSGLTGFSRRP